jgi:aryl sulfotransferase
MSASKPIVEHVYRNHTLDSTRWDRYSPRPDEIVITSSLKSGTTWMQMIVRHLIFQDLALRPAHESVWLELAWAPLEDVIQKIEGQQHRRYLKTHLPLDGLPYHGQAKYVVLGRDARDVFMSLWNHYSNTLDQAFDWINAGWTGEPFPRPPSSVRDFWQQWITRGWFDWESEGYPYWSNLRNVHTWWAFRHLPNILFVHYSDLLRDLEGEIQRIAAFLDIDVSDPLLPKIAHAVTFNTVKAHAEQIHPQAAHTFKGGANTFIYKGTNGRWRTVLTEADLQLYRAVAARELEPDCARWLENGRGAWT